MAGFQPMRSRVGFFTDDSDDVDDWMAQRNAQLSMRDAAEAAGREAWADGIESGADVDASTPHDLIRLGQEALANAGGDAGQDESSATSRQRLDPAQPDGPLLRPPSVVDFAAPADQAEAIIGQARRSPPPRPARPPTRPAASPRYVGSARDGLASRVAAYGEGYFGGLAPGAVRGVRQAAQSVAGGARLNLQMADPLRRALGHSALEPLTPIALGLVGGLADAVQDPRSAWNKVKAAGGRIAKENIPFAAPLPPTREAARGQARRVGGNDADLATNAIAMMPLGGEIGSALEGLEYAGKAGDVGRYLGMGFSLDKARKLAEPYVGIGHHVAPRRTNIFGAPLPDFIMNSRLNVLKPGGIDKGQFYGLHGGVDSSFYGGPIRGYGKGEGFSMARTGLPRYQGLERAWRGTTGYAKGVLSGGLFGTGYGLSPRTPEDQPK